MTSLPARFQKRGLHSVGLMLVLALLCSTVLAIVGPIVLWAYNLQRAGAEMEHGMVWPVPRRTDSLPTEADKAALDRALVHLAAAKHWRPQHAYAYRLAGHIYLARGQWKSAVDELERAHRLSPNEPLIAWDASLGYEQMQFAIERSPSVPLLEIFATGQLHAPGQLVRSQFCNEGGAATCYFGRTAYSQPDVNDSSGSAVTREVLFLHPPASLHATVYVREDVPFMRFVVGLDPVAREWKSDGATFRVAVYDGTQQTVVSELRVDAAIARKGWIQGWADLHQWVNKSVTVTIESDPGPSGDLTDDWYGWGDMALTSADVANFTPLHPVERMTELWRAAGQVPELFTRQADAAHLRGRLDDAQAWERRAKLLAGAP